jgi:phosphoglucomutase
LKQYKIVSDLEINIDEIQSITVQVNGKPFTIDIIDSVNDYIILMKEIFDFASIKNFLHGNSELSPFQILINSMNGGNVLLIYLKYYTKRFLK